MRTINDLTGQRFGKLTVIRFVERKNGMTLFECQCDCGAIRHVAAGNLRSGNSTGCRRCAYIENKGLQKYQAQTKQRLCPHCKERDKTRGSSYCTPCGNAYQRAYRARLRSEPEQYERFLELRRNHHTKWSARLTPEQRAHHAARKAAWYERRKKEEHQQTGQD